MIFATKPNRREIFTGSFYLIFNLFFLPGILNTLHNLAGAPLRGGQLNFLYFCLNFLIVCLIFREYLEQSLRDTLRLPLRCAWFGLLGYLGNSTLTPVVTVLCLYLYPEFTNVNDGSIALLLQEDFGLMALGTVALVPVAEEVLYRGLVFRSLYHRRPWAAYLVSTLLFSAIHVMGYIGRYQPLHLLLCLVQYLPAGYCLAFAYRHGGTIAAPIFMHILTNIAAVSAMR